jgi:ribosomal protein L31E
MPTKKMISVKECEKFAKINAQNAVNSYKQSKKRKPRAPSEYNKFVKQHMQADKIKNLPQNQRFKAVAAMWADQKKKKNVKL